MSDVATPAKLWNKSFLAVFSTNLFTANCFYILLACMPLFVVEHLHLQESYIGLVMGAFSITGVLARPLAGLMLDSLGRHKIFMIGLLVFLLCTLGYIFAATFAALITIRLLHGVGWGLVSTSGSTIAADVIPAQRRAEGLGYYAMTMSIGMALGPALGVFMLGFMTFQQIFICCSGLALLAFMAGFSVKVPTFEKRNIKFSISSLFEKRVLGIALMLFFYGIAYGSVMGFAIVYGRHLNVANSGLFFMIFAVIMTGVRPIIGKRLDRNGPGNTMGVGFITVIVSMLLLSQATGQIMYFAAAVVLGVGAGIVMPLLVAMAINVVAPNRRGAANATIYTAFDAGIGSGAVVLGRIADATSISTMYMFSCAVLIIPLVYYYMRGKRNYERSIIK